METGANSKPIEKTVFICTWELLPQQEEALLNRFIVLCPTQPFLVKERKIAMRSKT